jgi:galactokinase
VDAGGDGFLEERVVVWKGSRKLGALFGGLLVALVDAQTRHWQH